MSLPQLRVATFLCPSVPVELFQCLLEVLEEYTGHHATLQYEWRADGPVSQGKSNPFQANLIDLAFMPSSGYIALESSGKEAFHELLPVTPVFKHSSGADCTGTQIDIIVHADKLNHNVSQLLDLRGTRWACAHENSLANHVTLKMLREMGENVSFFGSVHRTNSHLEAVNMVLSKKADAATVDSCALVCNKRYLHNGGRDVLALTTFGPYSPYAVVISARIDEQLKRKITAAFSAMDCTHAELGKFGLLKFVPNHKDNYVAERELVDNVKMKIGKKVPYY